VQWWHEAQCRTKNGLVRGYTRPHREDVTMEAGVNDIEQRALNMPRMMRRLGVDSETAYGSGLGLMMARAARRCSQCRTVESCTAWLSRPPTDPAHRDFCPNAELFERMAG
jgi:hypothetical protein